MSVLTTGYYDEALESLHRSGPEFEGWLSNHGPMAVEALVRHGAGDSVLSWTDRYAQRLEDLPRGMHPIAADDWETALGDPRRLADWITFFENRLTDEAWPDTLTQWWPRLLPGIAAGATHGVIRVGHAVRALRDEESDVRVRELAHALGYWAGRWQQVPLLVPAGVRPAADLVRTVPRVPRQHAGIRDRLAQLDDTAGWMKHGTSLRGPRVEDVPAALDELVNAVVFAYPQMAVGEPTMLVHAATAPNAVARTLPSLPREVWIASYAAAWSATCAVLASYRSDRAGPERSMTTDVDEAWDRALAHGGEHVVKLADTALDVHARTGDPRALTAITTAVELDA